jgi:hypothetical protein
MTTETVLLSIDDELILILFGLECALDVELNPAETERLFVNAKDDQVSPQEYVFRQTADLTVTGHVDAYEPGTVWVCIESRKAYSPTLKQIEERARYQRFRRERRRMMMGE